MMFDPNNWRLLSRQQLDQDSSAAAEMFAYYANNPNGALVSWAGSKLQLMRRKVTYTVEELEHESYSLRLAAVFLLRDYWPKTEFTASAIARTLFSDQKALVRGAALNALSCFYGWICDPDEVLVSFFHITPDYKRFLIQNSKEHVKIVKNIRAKWVESIGQLAEEMLGDLSLVEQCLQSSDLQVRYVAFLVMATEMQPNSHIVSAAKRVIESRLEPSALRKAALGVLIRYRQITHDTSFDEMFVSLVKDELCPNEVRSAAYLALFDMRGLWIPDEVITRVGLNQFCFPDDVDWLFVDSFESGRGKKNGEEKVTE